MTKACFFGPARTAGLKNNCLLVLLAFQGLIYILTALSAQMKALPTVCLKRYIHYLTVTAEEKSNMTLFFSLAYITLMKYTLARTVLHMTGISLSACVLNWANDCFTKADE